MASFSMEGVKSEHCDVPVRITFFCRTVRTASIFWIDYNGRLVLYHNLRHGREFTVSSYLTHPWVFIDADCNDYLVVNAKDRIFYPSQIQNYIFIDIPAYTLLERSLQVVRKLTKKDQINELDIPRSLVRELLDSDRPPYDTYYYFQPVI